MARRFEIPGDEPIKIEHLLLDVNGTLTDRGRLIPGVRERIGTLREDLEVRLVSADTYGTLGRLADELEVTGTVISSGAEKADLARELGAERCAAIGNGRNDADMLAEVRLGIAIVGPEGLSSRAAAAAHLICPSIIAALDLLADPEAIGATLRR